MRINVNNTVTYQSAAGKITGVVTAIYIAPAADGSLQPWIRIGCVGRNSKIQWIDICGSENYLKMLKFEVVGK